ncbi:MAG: GyrI-like domain-containing protein [Candidatus Margulisbacteria bacterium]|nr:GyrI-like domain-containing protein [Candidatus Margulisiibacteriota bacterium]MBU1617500.1 GyrI-like domain-containing protein [Candidatus Margulisiibacteriota bacterium]MBU1867610.1 GyrI-like domain-containing protein [Candidatus Margulisiibacteriota bacterium]
MKILKIVLWVIALLAVALVIWVYYMGLFNKLEVTEREVGPYTLVYEDYIGPYQNTGAVVQAVYDRLAKDGIKPTDGFGIYLDDPSKVKQEKLRSQVGCVINENNLPLFYKVSDTYKVINWKRGKVLATEFPIRNPLSYMFGPMKAYPELARYMKKKKITEDQIGLCMEYYDMASNKIIFMFQVKGR